MVFFTYLHVRCSIHVYQHHLNIIFGNSNRILVYWGVGTDKVKYSEKCKNRCLNRQNHRKETLPN
jgi:hypothetical protein